MNRRAWALAGALATTLLLLSNCADPAGEGTGQLYDGSVGASMGVDASLQATDAASPDARTSPGVGSDAASGRSGDAASVST